MEYDSELRFQASGPISNDLFWCWEGDKIYYGVTGVNQHCCWSLMWDDQVCTQH